MEIEQQMKMLGARSTTARQAAAPGDVLDRYYLPVLGFAYQVLGDAELAAQASEQIFLHHDVPTTQLSVWKTTMMTIRAYLARGFVVRPLVAPSSGWQSDLLRGLALLAPLERALLLLRYHEGLEPSALAEVFGVPEPTIREQIAAARAQLIERMGG